MKRPKAPAKPVATRGKISRGILFALVLQILILGICLALMGVQGNIRSNEENKLLAPVRSRAGQLQHYLNSISLLAHSTGYEIAPLIDRGDEADALARMAEQLENSAASGIFFIAAGEGPNHPTLYVRDRYPATPHQDYSDLRYARGPVEYAKASGLLFDTQWRLDTEITENDAYYHKPVKAMADGAGPEACGYWNGAFIYPQTVEKVITYTLPLSGQDGGVLGVFGLELSINALRGWLPVLEIPFENAVYVFSKQQNGGFSLNADDAAVMGAYGSLVFYRQGSLPLQPLHEGGSLYRLEGGSQTMVGALYPVKLYSSGDYYDAEAWYLFGMAPKSQLDIISMQLLRTVALALMITIVISLAAAFAVSRWTAETVQMKERNEKELDELAALIDKSQNKNQNENQNARLAPEALFQDFIARVKTLTTSERAIFEYYVEGKSNQEVLSLLCISANTLKTHNRHIFAKLHISSRHELNLYIELIKRSGMSGALSQKEP